MKKDEILSLLSRHQGQLEQLGVKRIALFGSVARNEARPDSDVDILVEVGGQVGLFEFVGIKEYLEGVLGCRVDLVTGDPGSAEAQDARAYTQ